MTEIHTLDAAIEPAECRALPQGAAPAQPIKMTLSTDEGSVVDNLKVEMLPSAKSITRLSDARPRALCNRLHGYA